MKPSISTKLKILADAAKYDASCASSGAKRSRPKNGLGNSESVGICHSYTPDGRCVSLLKILLTNYCIYDCSFCVNRISSDTPRARFTVDEVVWLTVEFYKRNYIEGLFLSSGIVGSPDETMDELAEIAKRLRIDSLFGGYIHLKAVPGASPSSIEKAGRFADRLSANIELATQDDLNRFAPAKTHQVIEKTMDDIKVRIDEYRREKTKNKISSLQSKKNQVQFAGAGQSTQLVIGATPSTDKIILAKAATLYTGKNLKRVYYSAYSPIPHASPLLPSFKAPLLREHRLYQADWLFRFYGFRMDELFDESENLSSDFDPKEAWAIRNRGLFPVDINSCSREMLLRVPGLGVRSVNRIIQARRFSKLSLIDLSKLRISLKKVRLFISASDWSPSLKTLDSLVLPKTIQKVSQIELPLWSATHGEL